jgi:hypothetical protein
VLICVVLLIYTLPAAAALRSGRTCRQAATAVHKKKEI